jgi:hypothetical protein
VASWIPCSDGFIEADVVRWSEAVWKTGRRKGGRPVKFGERSVTAQVGRIDGEWVLLHVVEGRVTGEKQGRTITEVRKKGQEIRRKRHSIERGTPERLRWSDESARAAVASRFLAKSIGP